MNRLAWLLLAVCWPGFASEVEQQIRDHAAGIEEMQRVIAGQLVWWSFADFFTTQSDNHALNREISSFWSAKNEQDIQNASTALLQLIYSEKVPNEKLNEIETFLVLIRRTKAAWLRSASSVQNWHREFFDRVENVEQVCSEERFSAALSAIQFSSPEGVDTSALQRSYTFSAQGRWRGGGEGPTEFEYGPGGIAFDSSDGGGDERHAVAQTAGTVAYLFIPPPWNVVGAVAIVVAVEIVWAAVEMKDHMKELEKIAAANMELFDALDFSVNVRAHYREMCKKMQDAYRDVRPAILSAGNTLRIDELEDEVDRIQEATGWEKAPEVTAHMMTSDPETFYQASKMGFLSTAILVQQLSDTYVSNWHLGVQKINRVADNLEKVLRQIIRRKVEDGYAADERVSRLLERTRTLAELKTDFYERTLEFFDLGGEEERQRHTSGMRSLLDAYVLLHAPLGEHEEEFLEVARDALGSLEDYDG